MEWFDVCDENGMPTGMRVERSYAHSHDILHRTAHIWIVSREENRIKILMQKRAAGKDSFPGCWDTSSAGHITASDEPLPGALRELEEELGLKAEQSQLHFAGTFRIHFEDCFHGQVFRDNEVAFLYVYEEPVILNDLCLQKEEVETAAWFDLDTVITAIQAHDPLYCADLKGLKLLKEYLTR